MQKTIDTHQRYAVNPAYKFKSDLHNVILTNNNPARYTPSHCRMDITSGFAWRIHPDLAVLLATFNGRRTLDEAAAHFAEYGDMQRQRFLDTVSPCIGNSEPVLIPYGDRHWASIPKNFLIPNTAGIVRDDLLQGIDIPFIREHFDLKEVRLRVPNRMTLMVNTACATDCVYCYADKPEIRRPLPFGRIRELLREAYELGMPYVEVDGGDLFLYDHWRELLGEMRRYDYLPDISTKFPITEPIVEELKNLGIRHIQLSIDSVDSAELRRMLHVDDSYIGKVLHGLRLLDEAGFDVTIKPVITRFNDSEGSLNRTIDTLTAFGSVRRIQFTPAGFSRFKPTTYYSTRAQIDQLKTVVEQRNRDYRAMLVFARYEEQQPVGQRQADWGQRPLCTGNVHGFFVLPDGKVTLCEQLYWHPFFLLGDLNRQSIMEMWHSEKALSLWNFSREEVRDASPCKTCGEFDSCRRGLGNCWRQAIAAYGPENYDFPSPDCPKAPTIVSGKYLP